MPRLSEVARHVIAPAGITATEWPGVRDTCAGMGMTFDEWQDGAGRLILATDATGQFAADTVVMSIPRQVGKTFLIGAVAFGRAIRQPGLTVIWTAHRFKTAREMFSSMKALARLPEVAPHVSRVVQANGEESIEFRNGSRVLFGARENGFGLGFANVGMLILDEGQRLTTRAMDDLVPTMNAAVNPLVCIIGTPPRPTDPGEVFTMLRQEALDGQAPGTLYIEFSADDDADLDDRTQLAKANPSYPHRTSERSIQRMRKNLSDESFRREALGIFDKASVHQPIISASKWKALADAGPAAGDAPAAFGLDMSHSRDISIGACWAEDGQAHIEEVWAGTDPEAAIDWLAGSADRRTPIVVDSASPAASLAAELKARRLTVTTTTNVQMAQACGQFENRLDTAGLTHGGQPRLDAALDGARRRPIRDAGGWGWDRRDPTCSIYPLVAVTLALFGASNRLGRPARKRREVIVL